MDFQSMMQQTRMGAGGAPGDAPQNDNAEMVYISSLALIKMLKHGRAGVPMEVMGLMLGSFIDDYTVSVIDVFAMPQSGTGVSVEAVDPVFQTKMLDMLKQTGRPEMVVGWYHSHPGFGCWLSNVDINTQQSFEQLNPRAVAVVVDPIQSVKGKVVIDAFRLINPSTVMLGQEPRQTTSNIGHLNKPSIQSLIHGLNRHYYSIAIGYRKTELEQSMLNNLHKRNWTEALRLRDFAEHKENNRKAIERMLSLSEAYNKSVEEESTMTAEQLKTRHVGKQDPKRHLEDAVEQTMADQIVQKSEEAINQANQNPSTIIVEETEPQAGASARPKGGRKGKTVQVRTDNKSTNENEPEAVDNEVDEEADSNSDFDSGNKKYNFCTLAKLLEPVLKLTSCSYYSWSAHIKSFLRSVPHTMKHLEGAYDKKHPKWSCTLDDALTNALHGTIDTTGKHNVNYLILDIIREYLTFHQVWRRIENGLTNKATKMPHRLALISQLGNIKMFHSDARKLIQEIQSIQTESSLLGKPFADDTLFSALQKCMICHPVYKETVVTIHQIDFNTLALALSTRQTAVESIPAQKINPCQASTRIAGSNDQDKQAKEAEMSNDDTNAKVASRS
ncbi:related to RPN11 - 26S proteasome regulatory subunit [Ustilago bromivora]|uniref:Related to RPN11 - 26S proteasome regulatory subunit n=1 Tax=Ustilago bromivora TaxID=307758 RepID=A0A8H8TU52_9BASI|nr:related to RPN11 - 26S proteasome regulatory subunit [Ustilago bromivora]